MRSMVQGGAAGFGGGIFVNAGANGGGSIVNTIIAGNTAINGGADVSGDITSLGHNLIGDTTGSTGWLATDLLGDSVTPLDPRLSDLGWHGGPTQTMVLLYDSPALDAGDDTYATSLDQRGYTRIVGSHIDIGAVEMQPGEFANTAPTATAPTYNVNHDVTLNVSAANGLVAYCLDNDNDSLSIVAIDDFSSAIGNWVPTTLGGWIKVEADGSFVYSPPSGVAGADSFTFTVSDGYASATSTATINVTNNAPNLAYPVYNVNHDHTLNVVAGNRLIDYFSDNENDTLTISAINTNPANVGSAVTTTLGGTVTVQSDGSFIYNPPTGVAGQDTFTFTVFDGAGSTTSTCTINVINTAPNLAYPVYNVNHDQTLNVVAGSRLIDYFSDNEGDTLTISAINANPAGVNSLMPTTLGGTVTVQSDGSFIYNPPTGVAGQDTFTFTVFDGAGSTTSTCTINVTNTAPNLAYPVYNVNHDHTLNVVAGNRLIDYFSDNEGDTLTISAINGSPAGVGNTVTTTLGGTVTVQSDGSFIYNPPTGVAGQDTFTFTIFDGAGSTTSTCTINVIS